MAELLARNFPLDGCAGQTGSLWRRVWSAIWFLIGRSDLSNLDDRSHPFSWIPPAAILVINCGVLNLVAYAQGLGRQGSEHSAFFFWLAVFLLATPGAYWATLPQRDWRERLCILVIMGEAFYLLRFFNSPLDFEFFDEFLHWRTALDIREFHGLFASNPTLPVSPFYPGLELPTLAFSELAGTSIFASAIIIVGICRFLTICILFSMFRTAARSGRVAAIATLAFMGNSSFGHFHAQFAYETLGFVFFLYILRIILALENQTTRARRDGAILAVIAAVGLAVTHHLTSYLTAAIGAACAFIIIARPVRGQPRFAVAVIVLACAATPVIWGWAIRPPTGSYLVPSILGAVDGFVSFVSGANEGRKLFVASDGSSPSVVLQLLGISSVLSVAIGLTFGFFRTLTLDPVTHRSGQPGYIWPWQSSSALALGLLGAVYPITVAFRLTGAGWEIGSRLNSFVSVGAAFVVAISVTYCFQARWRGGVSRTALAGVLGVMIVGGMINGWGVGALRAPYRVGADPQSIEPLSASVAGWTRRHLGEGNRFATDRVNGILLLTTGRQQPLSTLFGDPSFASLFFSPHFGYEERNIVKAGDVDYMLVDLRLSSDLPRIGHYYEPGDVEAFGGKPPRLRDLLKYDMIPDVDRILDAGPVVIYDMRRTRRAKLAPLDLPEWVTCRACWRSRPRPARRWGESP